LGLRDVTPMLMARVGDKQLDPEARAAALRSLAALEPSQAAALARQSVSNKQPAIRVAALSVLARQQPADAVMALREATGSQNMRERQAAWDLLGAIELPAARQAIAEGVRRYLDGEIALDTQLNLLEAAEGALPETLQQDLTAAERKRAAASPTAAWAMVREGGDPQTGRRLFFTKTQFSCVRCHRVNGTGGQVGPDLSAVGRQRDRQYLLESIAMPDAAIAKGFETAVIADDLGTIHTGIVKRETDEEIELIDADGKRKVVFKEAIIDRKQGKSAMPADLVKLMSLREFRDLVAYLASLNAADPAASQEAHGER